MSADVADSVYGHQPRVEHPRAHAEFVRYLLAHGHRRTLIESDDHAKVHQIHKHPVRRQLVFVSVFSAEVDGEGFARTLVGIPAASHKLVVGVTFQPGQVSALEEAERSGLLRQ